MPILMAALAEEPRLMPHLHLSLQAGDDLILKRMKRRHLRADAIRFCETARRLRPGIAFGADLIAGFPTETEAMFERSLRLVDDCGLQFLHVFPYSPRQGTPAARMPQVEHKADQGARGAPAAKGGRGSQAPSFRPSRTSSEVLMEREGMGRTPDFAEIAVAGCSAGVLSRVPDHRQPGRAAHRRGCAVSERQESPEKKRGLFGRLFGTGRAEPGAPASEILNDSNPEPAEPVASDVSREAGLDQSKSKHHCQMPEPAPPVVAVEPGQPVGSSVSNRG